MYPELELDANSMAARCRGCNSDPEQTFNPVVAMQMPVAWMVASVDAVHETEAGARLVTGVDDGAGLAAGAGACAGTADAIGRGCVWRVKQQLG